MISDKRNRIQIDNPREELKYLIEKNYAKAVQYENGFFEVNSSIANRLNIINSRSFSPYFGAAENADLEFPNFFAVIEDAAVLGYSYHLLDVQNNVTINSKLFDFSWNGRFATSIPTEPIPVLEGDALLACSANSGSHYHTIAEYLAKLIVCVDANQTRFDYIFVHGLQKEIDLLRMLQFKGKLVKLADFFYKPFICERLFVPSSYQPNIFIKTGIVKKINKLFTERNTTLPGRNKILILRRQTRRFSNEEDLRNFLTNYGFSALYLEDYSLEDTLNIFNAAEVVIGFHGAGLTNIIFSKKVVVIEITSNDHSLLFSGLAAQLRFNHYFYVAEFNTETNTVDLDLAELKDALKSINVI
jgi:hypothetical protein